MNARASGIWFRVVTVILILFGAFFAFFGFRVFSDAVSLIPRDVLLPWTSALCGTIMIGWGVTLLFGRVAFGRNDDQLKRALLAGIAAWLVLEAAASAWFGVWFNVGVDVAVFALFAAPLLRAGSR